MAVESRKIEIGSVMPRFTLKDPFGKEYSSESLIGSKGLLVVFTCNHCPYAQAIWPRLIKLSYDITTKGINVVAINPNSANKEYPDDSVDEMIKRIKDWQIPFPYLVDTDQSVAKSYGAECTPDIYLIDTNMRLFYHGRFDDNWKDINSVKKEDLKEACYLLIEGKEPPSEQYPSMGCSIKWVY
ncbi:MAG: thioredoxin family protein [Brevinematales bacterium]|nr:thioredoxin family protein [Brevinematales bacterium]